MTETGVAIVGMAALFPGADSLATYWENLRTGVDAVTDVPAHRWDPEFFDAVEGGDRPDRVYCRRGGFVDGFAEFDPLRFGVMPASVAGIEPDQLIALRVAAAAMDDAGAGRMPAADRIGVVLGRGGYTTPAMVRLEARVRGANQVASVLGELLPELPAERLEVVTRRFQDRLGPHLPDAAIGLVPNLAASRVANRLNLTGPAYTVDAACASSLLAVDHAVADLARGRCDAVLAGGVHHCHDITFWSVFSQLRALSRHGVSRPFDRSADGLLIGEGTGVVVLKRVADAVRDGDRIYAVIRGTGVASDGRTSSLFNPDRSGQVSAMRQAWAEAGLDPTAPDAIGLLEAHGTGTPTGDAVELTTVAEVFGRPPGDRRAVIGSVKSMIGHTMPAAGIAGLIKAALAVHHGTLLPTLHCDDPRPELDAGRFAPLAVARPWDLSGPRRAGVNAFGFGGINAHVVLEEAPAPARSRRRAVAAVTGEDDVLWLRRPTPEALRLLLDEGDAAVRAADERGPAGDGSRLGIVGPTAQRLALARRVMERGTAWRGGRDIWFSPEPLVGGGGGVAFVFPGLEADFSPNVDDVADHFGLEPPPSAETDITWHAAAVFQTSRLMRVALDRLGVPPDAMAGHSLGEWSAMAFAGMFGEAQMERLLDSIDPGFIALPDLVFAAVGASADRVRGVLPDYPGVVLSHDNAPAQSIVCGPEREVHRLVARLQDERILSAMLPFRSGFHTPMFQRYLPSVRGVLDHFDMSPPRVPVWSGTTAAPFPKSSDEARELFLRHLVEPVRFRETITAMYDAGLRVFLQVGTGKIASVIQDVLAGRDHLAVPMNVSSRAGMDQLHRVATALWVEGAGPDRSVLRRPAVRAVAPAGPTGRPVRLDLGGALVRLGDDARELLGAPAMAPAAVAGRVTAPAAVAGRVTAPAAATAPAALAVRPGVGTAVAVPANGGPPHRNGNGGPARTVNGGPADEPIQRTLLYVSTAAMPYLLDHCLFVQRPDWPHLADRSPVVPATTMMRLMLQAVENITPGTRAVAIHDARFERWLVAAPPVDVGLEVATASPGRYAVRFGRYARATVEVGDAFPADRPAPYGTDPAEESPPTMTARQLYAERWLFHGPHFQGLTQLLGYGERHVRAMITVPEVPGSLLDNVGQVLGYWMQTMHTYRVVIFPVGIKSVRFFGPRPQPGTTVECVAIIREISDSHLIADAQLIEDGRVWAQFEGWTDRRFDSHPRNSEATRWPQRYPFADRHPEGWVSLFDRWPDLATRELMARNVFGSEDRADYEAHPVRTRRQWLMGRIAAKDAVRCDLWANGAGDVYPAEVRIVGGDGGPPRARGWSGRDIGEFDVSIAHCAEVAVAIARRAESGADRSGPGIGIDVEEIRPHLESTMALALTDAERRLLDERGAGTGTPVETWFVRFWAAKEAVAKAEGTGLEGRPKRFVVTEATENGMTVRVGERTYPVWHREFANPEDLPPRRYVAAWTWAPEGARGDGGTADER